MCKECGIQGYKTNQSLRVTATTRLYSSGVDEQLVMECTGHRSMEEYAVTNARRWNNKKFPISSAVLNEIAKCYALQCH